MFDFVFNMETMKYIQYIFIFSRVFLTLTFHAFPIRLTSENQNKSIISLIAKFKDE